MGFVFNLIFYFTLFSILNLCLCKHKHFHFSCVLGAHMSPKFSVQIFVFAGTNIFTFLVFWVSNIFLIVLDLTGKPAALLRYKVQPDKNIPVSFWSALHILLLNKVHLIHYSTGCLLKSASFKYILVRWLTFNIERYILELGDNMLLGLSKEDLLCRWFRMALVLKHKRNLKNKIISVLSISLPFYFIL